MDIYTLLRFLHVIGFIFIGGGLLAIWVSEWRGYSATRPLVFAEAAHYTAILYDFVVLPGALLVAVTGPLLIWKAGFGYFDMPWLTAMWALFLFEFVEGNTVTRLQFRRTLRISRSYAGSTVLTPEMKGEARTLLGRFTHFLDMPLFSVIVYCGVTRTNSWVVVGAAIAIAIVVTLFLAVAVPAVAARAVRTH